VIQSQEQLKKSAEELPGPAQLVKAHTRTHPGWPLKKKHVLVPAYRRKAPRWTREPYGKGPEHLTPEQKKVTKLFGKLARSCRGVRGKTDGVANSALCVKEKKAWLDKGVPLPQVLTAELTEKDIKNKYA